MVPAYSANMNQEPFKCKALYIPIKTQKADKPLIEQNAE